MYIALRGLFGFIIPYFYLTLIILSSMFFLPSFSNSNLYKVLYIVHMRKVLIWLWHLLSLVIVIMTIGFALLAIIKPQIIAVAIEFVREKILFFGWKNYLLVLWLGFLESIPFINIAIPWQTLMVIISGFMAQENTILTIVCVIAASILWDLVAYYLWKYKWESILRHYGTMFGLTKERVDKLKDMTKDNAHRAIFASKWNSYTRWMLSFISGMAHMRLGEFMLYNVLWSITYSVVIVYLAKLFIGNYTKVVPYLRWIGLWIIAAGIIWYLFRQYYNARKTR